MGRKRKNGEGTVRLRKDGRWEGRVVIGYDDKGLPKTKNVLAKTKSECVEKLKTLKDALAPPAPPRIKADMPFGDWMEHWYETHSRPAARPGTRRIYEGYLRLYINPGLGHIPLNRLTAKDMQQFFTWLKTEGRADQSDGETGLADSQLRNIHSLCRRALEKAVSEDLIPQNPASGCKLPPARKGEMNILSRESMQKLLIQAKEEKYYELFLLEFTTGLRLGELTALKWEDLNLTIHVRLQQNSASGLPPADAGHISDVINRNIVQPCLQKYAAQKLSSRSFITGRRFYGGHPAEQGDTIGQKVFYISGSSLFNVSLNHEYRLLMRLAGSPVWPRSVGQCLLLYCSSAGQPAESVPRSGDRSLLGRKPHASAITADR